MSNENDEQAPYGEKREPLIRSKTIESFARNATERIMTPTIMDPCFDQAMLDCSRVGEAVGQDIRDLYENLISKGELRVVKKVKFVTNNYDGNIDCDSCGWSICYIHVDDNPMSFCPGCGGEVEKG